MPDARRKRGMHSKVRIEGAEKVMLRHADVVFNRVSAATKRSEVLG